MSVVDHQGLRKRLKAQEEETAALRGIVQRVSGALTEFESLGEIDADHLKKIIEGYYETFLRVSCNDCQGHVECYMVHNHLWEQAWKGQSRREIYRKTGKGVFLCLSCLEKRLGRSLEVEDFPEGPVNEMLHWGARSQQNGVEISHV